LRTCLRLAKNSEFAARILHIHDDADIRVLVTDLLMSPFTKAWLWDKSQRSETCRYIAASNQVFFRFDGAAVVIPGGQGYLVAPE
jgi:hypothetical protein